MLKDNQLIYDFRIALISIKKTPILSALMVAAIGIGIGAFMTLFTLYISVSRDPIPEKSDQLYTYALDNRLSIDDNESHEHPRPLVSYPDYINLAKSNIPAQQSVHYRTWSIYRNTDNNVKPFWELIRFNNREFFTMFEVPFLYGSSWTKEQEDNKEYVIVLPKELNDKLFGGINSVGKKLQVDDRFHTIVGVTDDFSPMPKYMEFDGGITQDLKGAYIPFSLATTLKIDATGGFFCAEELADQSFDSVIAAANCSWLHHWVLLPTPKDRDAYLEFLNNYSIEQQRYGRFQGDFKNRIYNVSEWVDRFAGNNGLLFTLIGIAFIFLVVCLLNTNALLFAKFTGKKNDICVKRALGCSKTRLFSQHLVEVTLIGLIGGILGLILTTVGLQGLIVLLENVKNEAQIDLYIITIIVGTAIFSTLITGLYPAWKICQLAPSRYLKAQ